MLRISKMRHYKNAATYCVALACGLAAGTSSVQAQPPKNVTRNAEEDADPQIKAKVNQLIDVISESEAELELTKRHSKLVRTKLDILRVAVSDPTVVEVVAFGPREAELIGKDAGSTTLTLWMGNAQQPQVLSLLVTVQHDTGVEDRRRMEYGELQTMLNELFPNSKIQLFPVADKLIVKGEARDAEEATRIMSVVRKQGGGGMGMGMGMGMGGGSLNQGAAADPFPDASNLPASNVISLLEVPGEMQVMLKVRIAELKRSAMRNLSSSFSFSAGDFSANSIQGGTGNLGLTGVFQNGSFNLFIEALAQNGTAKILAEPNLVTLSGRPATFLAGGEFAVPTVVGVGGVQAVSTYFKGFGTALSFTPTVLDKDRIRLQVMPTFSTLNRGNSVGGVFGLDTRTTSTMVDLREGQTLAIAGLIQEQMRNEKSRVPFFGDLPFVGFLASANAATKDETELIVMVTPEFVHPLEPDEVPPILPGMDVTEPDDVDFWIYGRWEGHPECNHRSTIFPVYQNRACYPNSFPPCRAKSEDYFISGPHGFSN